MLRFYGFEASELLTEERPYFHQELDPKCDWAIRHLENFPVEINRADYTQILRIPEWSEIRPPYCTGKA